MLPPEACSRRAGHAPRPGAGPGLWRVLVLSGAACCPVSSARLHASRAQLRAGYMPATSRRCGPPGARDGPAGRSEPLATGSGRGVRAGGLPEASRSECIEAGLGAEDLSGWAAWAVRGGVLEGVQERRRALGFGAAPAAWASSCVFWARTWPQSVLAKTSAPPADDTRPRRHPSPRAGGGASAPAGGRRRRAPATRRCVALPALVALWPPGDALREGKEGSRRSASRTTRSASVSPWGRPIFRSRRVRCATRRRPARASRSAEAVAHDAPSRATTLGPAPKDSGHSTGHPHAPRSSVQYASNVHACGPGPSVSR